MSTRQAVLLVMMQSQSKIMK